MRKNLLFRQEPLDLVRSTSGRKKCIGKISFLGRSWWTLSVHHDTCLGDNHSLVVISLCER